MVGKFSTDVLNLIELLNVIKAVICAVKNVCSLQVTSTAIIIRMMANGITSASTEEEQREGDDVDKKEPTTMEVNLFMY